ncbi:MAG: AEC family transporter [Chloroflexi bacterium]|nr:AEC family transporter [Chloroflexota bacterium]
MTVFINIFANNVLPVFLVMAVGLFLDRKLQVDKRHLARIALYVLTPALIFSRIVQSLVDPAAFGQMLVFVVAFTLIMCALGLLIGRLLGWSSREIDALVLSVAFLNAGNFGLSVVLFTYGDEGLQLATVFFVGSNFTANTLSAFFAARSNHGARGALLKTLRLPGLWAFLLALAVRLMAIPVPNLVLRPLMTLGNAYVPVMLMLLGLQLSQTRLGHQYGKVALGVGLRLVVGALAALGLAPLMGLEGLARQVGVLEASMPTAVNSSLMAIEFDANAEYVSSCILVSTLFSSVTLTLLIAFL